LKIQEVLLADSFAFSMFRLLFWRLKPSWS
jgi:hypothetical protein